MAAQTRNTGPYIPGQKTEYKISRSKIELFMQCPRCFWLDARLRIKRPDGPPFSLNKAVDELLKKEFDVYRKAAKPHPIMLDNQIKAVPYQHADLDKWRENFVGVGTLHKPTNLYVFGAVDDLWVNEDGELMVVDYKATAKASEVTLDAAWQISYKRQVEVYQWLLRQNGFKVNDSAFFVYTNGRLELDGFNDHLEFSTKLIEYVGDDSWVEKTLEKMKACIEGDIPPVGMAAMGGPCDYCEYARKRTELTLGSLKRKLRYNRHKMIDIQLIRDNPELVSKKSSEKGYEIDTDEILGFDKERRELSAVVENLRQKRNQLAAEAKGQKPSEHALEEGRKIKDELADNEHRLVSIEQSLNNLLKKVPNMPSDDVPVGSSEDDNQVVKEVGNKPEFSFTPKSHAELAKDRGWLDTARAAKVAGGRFAYIKGDLVNLQFAIVRFTFDTLGDQNVIQKIIDENNLGLDPKPFTPVIPPALIKTDIYEASSRLNAEEVTYKIEQDDLWLNASAEHSLCTMYADEIIPEKELPIRYIGYSTSFRREAGTYGKDMEGMFRMHQFDKLEMEVFSTPETSMKEHLLLIAIQEYLVNQLELPYQVILKCTADIGFPNARGVDINTWLPGQGKYRETHTADYITDFQARSLKTRVKRTSGGTELIHNNDATAFALSRIPIAIIENNQTQDGQVNIPKALQRYMNDRTTI